MKVASILSVAALTAGAVAVPLNKRAGDADILQFALTLEHLENAFYKQALQAVPQSAFRAANLTDQYYNDVKQISYDEQTHVSALTSALQEAGVQPVAACTYDFGTLNLHSFITLSAILEGVGTSAYLGAAPSVMSKEYLTVAGSILSVEALHTSLQRFALGLTPMANPFYPPIVPNGAYSLASAFIKSCPSSNPPLPFKAYPALTATIPTFTAAVGSSVMLKTGSAIPNTAFVTFVSGLSVISVKPSAAAAEFTAAVPAGVSGQTYVFITNANVTAISDSVVLFGPAIVEVSPPDPVLDYGSY